MAQGVTGATGQIAGTVENAPVAPARSDTKAPVLSRRRRREGLLFLIPALLFQLVWGWYPLVMAFIISFTNARLRGSVEFTGLESYTRMWNDPLAAQAFRVTAIYSVLAIGLTFLIPIIVAVLLMEMPRRAMRWMMLLWFLPLSGIANILLWRYFYNSQYGLFQWIATSLGFEPQPFLNSGDQVLFWLVFPGIIAFGPGLIYMAGLQGIPASYYEAAEVEGASFWRKIWTVSLPRLRPLISMMLIFGLIGTSQVFEFPLIMTGGGPGGASRTVVMYLYELLQNLRYADATALGVYLFAVTMALVIIYRLIVKEDPDA